MKMSREGLKALVKELLVEVLQEGLGFPAVQPRSFESPVSFPALGNRASAVSEGASLRPRGSQASVPRRPPYDPRLDVPVNRAAPVQQPSSGATVMREAIQRESGGNSVLADLLADTAATMSTVPDGSSPRITAQEQFNGEPAAVFGAGGQQRADGSTHWADLAFMGFPKKPS